MSDEIASGISFRTTRWTMVVSAQAGDSPQSSEALSRLCSIYWRPVYHFIRHYGHNQHDAEDLTQSFFKRLIEKNYLKSIDQKRGKFRSFLMAATKHFLSDQRDRRQAWKRGGRVSRVSLDLLDVEHEASNEFGATSDPELAFDRAWARTVLDRALERLRQLFESRGKGERFVALRPCLLGEGIHSYAEIAHRLSVSEAVVKTEVIRMRRSFRQLLREEVAETLDDRQDLDSELRYLGSLTG